MSEYPKIQGGHPLQQPLTQYVVVAQYPQSSNRRSEKSSPQIHEEQILSFAPPNAQQVPQVLPKNPVSAQPQQYSSLQVENTPTPIYYAAYPNQLPMASYMVDQRQINLSAAQKKVKCWSKWLIYAAYFWVIMNCIGLISNVYMTFTAYKRSDIQLMDMHGKMMPPVNIGFGGIFFLSILKGIANAIFVKIGLDALKTLKGIKSEVETEELRGIQLNSENPQTKQKQTLLEITKHLKRILFVIAVSFAIMGVTCIYVRSIQSKVVTQFIDNRYDAFEKGVLYPTPMAQNQTMKKQMTHQRVSTDELQAEQQSETPQTKEQETGSDSATAQAESSSTSEQPAAEVSSEPVLENAASTASQEEPAPAYGGRRLDSNDDGNDDGEDDDDDEEDNKGPKDLYLKVDMESDDFEVAIQDPLTKIVSLCLRQADPTFINTVIRPETCFEDVFDDMIDDLIAKYEAAKGEKHVEGTPFPIQAIPRSEAKHMAKQSVNCFVMESFFWGTILSILASVAVVMIVLRYKKILTQHHECANELRNNPSQYQVVVPVAEGNNLDFGGDNPYENERRLGDNN